MKYCGFLADNSDGKLYAGFYSEANEDWTVMDFSNGTRFEMGYVYDEPTTQQVISNVTNMLRNENLNYNFYTNKNQLALELAHKIICM